MRVVCNTNDTKLKNKNKNCPKWIASSMKIGSELSFIHRTKKIQSLLWSLLCFHKHSDKTTFIISKQNIYTVVVPLGETVHLPVVYMHRTYFCWVYLCLDVYKDFSGGSYSLVVVPVYFYQANFLAAPLGEYLCMDMYII